MVTDSTVGRGGTAIALACFLISGAFLVFLIALAPAAKAEAQGANVSSIDQEIANLESRVSALESQVASLTQQVANQGKVASAPYVPPTYPATAPYHPYGTPAYGYPYGTPTYPVATPAPTAPAPLPTGSGRIDQNGEILNGGWTAYFTGHGFGADEEITVTSGGTVVATAETDGGGSFSAGVPIPATPGAYSFTFTGETSGITATATITSSRTIGHVQF